MEKKGGNDLLTDVFLGPAPRRTSFDTRGGDEPESLKTAHANPKAAWHGFQYWSKLP